MRTPATRRPSPVLLLVLAAGVVAASQAPPSKPAGQAPPPKPASQPGASKPAAPRPPARRALSGTVMVDGGSLYYEIKGEGRPVVLIHGGNLDSRMWDGQFEKYSRSYKVIRYDVRGYGKSSLPAARCSNFEDLFGLLQALGIGRVSIVGLSLGGRIAVDFALAHPAMVDALVLAAPGLSGYSFSTELRDRLGRIVEAARNEGPTRATELWLADAGMEAAMANPAIAPRIRQLVVENERAWQAVDLPEKELDPPAIGRLTEIHVPTLVVVGSRDVPDIQTIADLVVAGVAGAKKVTITGAGHLVNMEKPAAFDGAVLTFLGEARGRKSEGQ